MYSKIFVSVLFSILFALAAVAAPQPDPQHEERDTVSISSAVNQALSSYGTPSMGGEIFESVASVHGKPVTIVSSQGGGAITLDGSKKGVVTSTFGGEYTIAADANPTSKSSALVPHAGVQTSVLVALGSILIGALLGMTMTL